jgi:hypothetical protein
MDKKGDMGGEMEVEDSDATVALADAFCVESVPVLTVKVGADPSTIARALVAAANSPVPLALTALDHWWAVATIGQRTRLVFRLMRALPHVDSQTAHRLNDPRWRHAVGLPLFLAEFVATRRAQRQHRAQNTLRAWRDDWGTWRRWCKAHGQPSFNPSADQIRVFFVHYGPTHKVATIRRFGASLTAMHRAAGFADPLNAPLARERWLAALKPPKPKRINKSAEHPPLATAASLKPIDRRSLGLDKAEPLRFDLLQEIIGAIDTRTLIGKRDEALLRTTYDMVGRRSEILALAIGDITPSIDKPGVATALIRRSKTDQAGAGASLFLRRETVAAIEQWKTQANITEPGSLLFRSLRGFAGSSGNPVVAPGLQAAELSRVIKRRVGALIDAATGKPRYDAAIFSGHSCRVGAAQDMALAGFSDAEIMQQGRWRSREMLYRYISTIRAEQAAMARLAERQAAAMA